MTNLLEKRLLSLQQTELFNAAKSEVDINLSEQQCEAMLIRFRDDLLNFITNNENNILLYRELSFAEVELERFVAKKKYTPSIVVCRRAVASQ